MQAAWRQGLLWMHRCVAAVSFLFKRAGALVLAHGLLLHHTGCVVFVDVRVAAVITPTVPSQNPAVVLAAGFWPDCSRDPCVPACFQNTHIPLPSSQIQGLLARWGQGLGDSPKTYEAAEQPYSQELEPLAVGVFDADAPGAYNSHFKTMANQQEGECCRHRSYPTPPTQAPQLATHGKASAGCMQPHYIACLLGMQKDRRCPAL